MFNAQQLRVQVGGPKVTVEEGSDTYMSFYMYMAEPPKDRDNFFYWEGTPPPRYDNVMTWWVQPKEAGGALIGYGTGQTQTVTASAASQNATSITTTSFTSNAAYAIGTAVVPLPNIQENPSNANLKANQSSVLEQYSGNLSAGAFTSTQTTGAGNRSMQVLFVFKNSTNGGTTSTGNYTDLWLVNVSSAAAANNYVDHLINSSMRVDNSNNISASVLIKI